MAKIGVSDTYFAGEEGIYKVYDFDYEAKVQYYTDLEKSKMFGLFFIPHAWFCAPVILGYMFSGFIEKNTSDFHRGQHFAVTVDGAKFVQDSHLSAFRCECTRKGKSSRTHGYDKITNVDVIEGAGSSGCFLCMVPNTLDTLKIENAGVFLCTHFCA